MKRLVLLGGGHAHVQVLKAIAASPPQSVAITLVTPYARQIYSGMLPGWLAGHYALDDCMIALPPLATAAKTMLRQTACAVIDADAKTIRTTDGETIGYDVLSIDTGSVAHHANLDGHEHMLTIRPLETFIHSIQSHIANAKSRTRAQQPFSFVVIGAGAAGVEMTLALKHALKDAHCEITLVSAANTLPGNVAPRVVRALQKAGVTHITGVAASRVTAHDVTLADGRVIKADVVIAALGARAATWPRESWLACDTQGYIRTNAFLQSVSHPAIFAAGDCASIDGAPRPKSGVYAVRAGPPLAENLFRHLRDEALVNYTPQSRSLYLIATGGKHAIASWGNFAWQGDWVWHWKNRIDRAFMAKYKI